MTLKKEACYETLHYGTSMIRKQEEMSIIVDIYHPALSRFHTEEKLQYGPELRELCLRTKLEKFMDVSHRKPSYGCYCPELRSLLSLV